MISLLARFFCKSDGKSPAQLRTAYGILCGAVGIGLNLLLFLGKFFAGTLSGSVAITADAFNNLSDAGSSVVTLLGFRIAAKAPDPGHPFGHGRAEYLSGLAVSMLILLMGVELAKESLNKILHPALVEFSWLVIGILAASICVKLYMAMYNRSLGKKLSAPALLAAAADSLGDCMSTSAVLVATLIGHYFQLPVDGWVGILVALFIFKGGIDAAKDTIDPLLGKPPTPEFVKEIEDLVMAHKEISGIHDLVVHDYGPGRVMISLHAEVPATGSVMTIHDAIDNIEQELHRKLGCEAVIHMDPIATDDSTTVVLRNKITELAHCIDPALSIHDFRMVPGPTHTNLIFDVVTPFGFRLEDAEVARQLRALIRAFDSHYVPVTVGHPSNSGSHRGAPASVGPAAVCTGRSFLIFPAKGLYKFRKYCYNNRAVWGRSSAGRRSGSLIAPLFLRSNSVARKRFPSHKISYPGP